MFSAERRREMMLYVITFIVLGSALLNYYDRGHTHAESALLRDEVKAFMRAGPRNTAYDGYALCLRIAHLEAQHHDIENEVDCAQLYFRKSGE